MALSFITAIVILFSSIPVSIVNSNKNVEDYYSSNQAYYAALTGIERFKDHWDKYLNYSTLNYNLQVVSEIQGQIGEAEIEKVEIQCISKYDKSADIKVTSYGRYGSKKIIVVGILNAIYQTNKSGKILSTVSIKEIYRQIGVQ